MVHEKQNFIKAIRNKFWGYFYLSALILAFYFLGFVSIGIRFYPTLDESIAMVSVGTLAVLIGIINFILTERWGWEMFCCISVLAVATIPIDHGWIFWKVSTFFGTLAIAEIFYLGVTYLIRRF